MKKLIALTAVLFIGIATLAPNAKAAPIGNGLGNACCVPAVNNWCYMQYPGPLGNSCACPQVPYYGYIC